MVLMNSTCTQWSRRQVRVRTPPKIPQVFDTSKGPLRGRDMLMRGGGCHAPNIFKIARELDKRQPCCKRIGHIIFHDLLFSLVTVAGQMVKATPPQWKGHYLVWKLLFYTNKVIIYGIQKYAFWKVILCICSNSWKFLISGWTWVSCMFIHVSQSAFYITSNVPLIF